MFAKLFSRQKPRVFLGTLAVAPRSDIRRRIEDWSIFGRQDLDGSLGRALREIFTLPPAADVIDPLPNDLGLDVIIPRFQSGDLGNVSLGELSFPLFWRPKVTIASRLYFLRSAGTKKSFSVTAKMGWGEYFSRVFSWSGLFRFRPLFDEADMQRLTYQACHELLERMERAR